MAKRFDYRKAKNILKRQGRKQIWLARECDLSKNYVALLFNGHRLPSAETLGKIASKLEVPEAALLRDAS